MVVDRTGGDPDRLQILTQRLRPFKAELGARSASMAFVMHSPAATTEGICRAAATTAQGNPSIEDVLALAQQHGIEMLGPVPATV